MRLPGFGGSPSPPAPAPLPTMEDPAVETARKKQRMADLQRKGRGSTVLTGGLGDTSETTITRPGATVLGGGGN